MEIEKRSEVEIKRRYEAHRFFIDLFGDSHPRIRLDPRPPETRILEIRNIELRREFIEKEYGGYENFFQAFSDCHEVLQMTGEGTLHCFKSFASGSSFKMVVLEVRDSSHSEKHHFIPVPREFKTVHEARAWTFGMKSKEFHPIVET